MSNNVGWHLYFSGLVIPHFLGRREFTTDKERLTMDGASTSIHFLNIQVGFGSKQQDMDGA